jgi:predicted ATPase
LTRIENNGSGSNDFLKKNAETPLCGFFLAAGAICEVRTNSRSVLEAAQASFVVIEPSDAGADLRMRFWVDANEFSPGPWPKPYARGLEHLVFAGFDSTSSALIDLHSHRIVGRFSEAMAADISYWQAVIFPMLLSIAGGSLGIAEIHCACVARAQKGLLLAGPSGSGKSTLSVALARSCFGFVSDDRTYCSHREARLSAWGLPACLKLRADATTWFHELRGKTPDDIQKGEPVFRLNPEDHLGFKRVPFCDPRTLVFLERDVGVTEFRLQRISSSEASALLDRELMAELPEARRLQSRTIAKLAELPCWHLRYSGRPESVSQELARQFDQLTTARAN